MRTWTRFALVLAAVALLAGCGIRHITIAKCHHHKKR